MRVTSCRAGLKGDAERAPLTAALVGAHTTYRRACTAAAGDDSVVRAEAELQAVRQQHMQVGARQGITRQRAALFELLPVVASMPADAQLQAQVTGLQRVASLGNASE